MSILLTENESKILNTHILLVEDDAYYGELMYRWLHKNANHSEVQWIKKGSEAVEWLSEQRCDLLLLDIDLSDMPALDLLDAAFPAGKYCPFIIISETEENKIIAKAQRRGAKSVLVKSNKMLEGLSGQLVNALREIKHSPRLNEQSTLYYDLLENANDAIYFHDKNGMFVYLNRKAENLTGYNRRELLGKSINRILWQDGKKIFRQKLRKDRVLKWDRKFEIEIKTKYNKIIPVELTVSPILQDKKLIGFEGVARDIQERKKAQKLLEKREAYIHRLNVEIQKKNMKLEERTRIQSEFVSNISHEFRTPINGIIGYTDLLLDAIYGQLKKEQITALENIKGCASNLLTMLQEILDWSKIKSNQLELTCAYCSPQDLIEATVGTIRPIAQQKKLVVEKVVDADLTPIYADFQRLYQVFVHLAGNAVKFTSEGKITIGARRLSHEIQFFVMDTGIGVKTEIKEMIFQEFRQGDGSNTRFYGGIGLGLSLSKRLIAMHDGQIGVESGNDGGSTFYFNIPLQRKPEKVL